METTLTRSTFANSIVSKQRMSVSRPANNVSRKKRQMKLRTQSEEECLCENRVFVCFWCSRAAQFPVTTRTMSAHQKNNSKKRSASTQLSKNDANKKPKRENRSSSDALHQSDSTTSRKKLFVSHVQMAHKQVYPSQKLSDEDISIVESLRKHDNDTVAIHSAHPVGFVSVALQCLHEMISTYFKPHDGTFAIFITPNEYSAFSIHSTFEKFMDSQMLKSSALGSLFLQHNDVELNKTKNDIASLARRERGAVIVSPSRNLPFFIRGKGASLVKIEKLKYVFVVDPIAFASSEEKRTDLSHSLNRLAKSGSKFKLVFLSERSLPFKPAQFFVNDLIQSPVTSLSERLSKVHLEKVAHSSPQALSLRPMLNYYHEVPHAQLIPTIVAMLKSTMNIPRPTKTIMFTSSKIVLKFVEHVLRELDVPIIASSINKNVSVRSATYALEQYAHAKKGVLLATDRFANSTHHFPDTDFFFFLDTPVDKENFVALGKLAGKVTAHKIVITPPKTHDKLVKYLGVEKMNALKMKQIDAHPTKKVHEAITAVATREAQLAQKSAQQFLKLRASRAEKVFGASLDEHSRKEFILSPEESAKNFGVTDIGVVGKESANGQSSTKAEGNAAQQKERKANEVRTQELQSSSDSSSSDSDSGSESD